MRLSIFIFFIIIILLFIFFIKYENEIFGNVHKKIYPVYYNTDGYDKYTIQEEKINEGKKIIKNKKIVFTGLARNIEERIDKNIKICERLGELFEDYRIIIFENDSKDKTREIIKNCSLINNKVILLECGDDNPNCIFNLPNLYYLGDSFTSNKRIDKMAYFRNKYLEYIKKNYSNYDYMCVIDLDIEGTPNKNGFIENFAEKDWDGIFVNGRMNLPAFFGLVDVMYDSLAYLPVTGRYEDCKTQTSMINLSDKLLQLNSYNIKSNLIPVKSAFNGIAIYSLPSIINSNAFYPYGWNCEHIGFHSLICDSKFFINKNWIVYVGKQGP